MPFATPPYRLNVLSALGSALTVWMLYRLILNFASRNNLPVDVGLKATAGLTAMVLGTSYLQWYLSLVSEMYTINTFVAMAVLAAVYYFSAERELPVHLLILAAFAAGLGLGVRMDLLLITPAALWVLWSRRGQVSARTAITVAVSFLAGFSIFAYLYIRSNTAPMLDWNHPATLERLWGSIARKTHGGTLDLISESYASGENFLVGMKFYFTHLRAAFTLIGLGAACLGLYGLWRKNRVFTKGAVFAWLASCPVFIYISNIPPNTHAFAILEAHFLLPNTIVAVFVAYGVFIVLRRYGHAAGAALAALLLAMNLAGNAESNFQRDNFFDHDYVRNVLRSMPDNGTVVMKKDVQVFSLWAAQYVMRLRQAPAVVAQGLCASPWYQAPFNKKYPGIFLGPLRSAADWRVFYEANKTRGPVFFSGDAEYLPPAGLKADPCGILYRLNDSRLSADRGVLLFSEIYSLRGRFDYNGHHDFFTSDLVGDYGRGCFEIGTLLIEQNEFDMGRGWLARGFAMQPLQPQAATMRAYSYFLQEKYQQAFDSYISAAAQYAEYWNLAARYKALPAVMAGIKKDHAEAFVSAGVCQEKLGALDESLKIYSKALEIDPAHAKAYFNRGVVYWRKGEWTAVIRELQEATRIDPNYREAAYYLQVARQKLK